ARPTPAAVRCRPSMISNLLTSIFLIAAVVLQAAVTVVLRGPAGLRIEGISTEVTVEEETSTLGFFMSISDVDTVITLSYTYLGVAVAPKVEVDVELAVVLG